MEDCARKESRGRERQQPKSLGGENAGSSGFLDLLFRLATEEFCLHDERNLGQMTLAKDLQG